MELWNGVSPGKGNKPYIAIKPVPPVTRTIVDEGDAILSNCSFQSQNTF